MSEYRVVQNAEVSPTRCYFCMEFAGPFIDTHMEDVATGHIYICGPNDLRSGCIGQMAHFFGMLTDLDAKKLRSELKEAREQITKLEEERLVTIGYEDLVKFVTPRKALRT